VLGLDSGSSLPTLDDCMFATETITQYCPLSESGTNLKSRDAINDYVVLPIGPPARRSSDPVLSVTRTVLHGVVVSGLWASMYLALKVAVVPWAWRRGLVGTRANDPAVRLTPPTHANSVTQARRAEHLGACGNCLIGHRHSAHADPSYAVLPYRCPFVAGTTSLHMQLVAWSH